MKLFLVAITPRRLPKSDMADALVSEYLHRSARYCHLETAFFRTEMVLLEHVDKQQARTPTHLVLLDPRGKLLSSEAFAVHLGGLRDSGTQNLTLAVGPADGWTDAVRARADLLLSLGPMTLAHDLARVVLAEQVYRALTILAGHPYHCGH